MDTATESGEQGTTLTGWEGLLIVALLACTVGLFIGVNQCYLWYYSEDHAKARAAERVEARQAAIEKALADGLSAAEADLAGQKAADEVGPEIVPAESMPKWIWVVLAVAYLILLVVCWVFTREESVVRPTIEAAAIFAVIAGLFLGTNQLYRSYMDNRAEQQRRARRKAAVVAASQARQAGATADEVEASAKKAADEVGPLTKPPKWMPMWMWAALAAVVLVLLVLWWALASEGVTRSVLAAVIFFAFTAWYFIAPPKLYAPYIRNKSIRRAEARKLASQAAMTAARSEGKSEEEIEKIGKEAADKVGPAIRADKPMPIWMWIVLGAIYIMIVTVWWTPGDEKANNTELVALAIVACGTAVVAAIVFQEQVVGIVKEFWNIMATGGGRTG